jgi:outer membrane protein assembly factor BamB
MKRHQLAFVFVMSVLIPDFILSQNWPQWRGPNRDGVIQEFKTPDTWPNQLKLVWKIPVGGGISSPIVSGGKAWLHTRKEESEVVSCIDVKSGKIIWTKEYPAPFKPNPAAVKMGNGPFATPVFHDGQIYTLGISGILSCFDAHSGELKWRKSFDELNTSSIYCGTASSPLIDGKNLIVQIGDDRRGELIAFDQKTGEEKWKLKTNNVSYASPIH